MNPIAKYAEEESARRHQVMLDFNEKAGEPHALYQYTDGGAVGIWKVANGAIAVVQRPDGKYDPHRTTHYPLALLFALHATQVEGKVLKL